MKQKELFRLLDNIQEQGPETELHERILFIDGLNLFFRNFAVLNMVNPQGVHVGGLGGFFRSLGAMIRQMNPTQVYVIFDGAGSANNRKNIMPEYKSGRDLQRITNWDAFDDKDDEDDAKVDQMVRIIQYLKTLPVKTISIPKVEADDVIAYLSKSVITHPKDKSFIVSSDKDFLQLVSDNVIVYRPMEKEYYTSKTVIDKYKISPHNFILHKTLLNKMSDHVIYARIIHGRDDLEKNYKIMDLSNPMLSKEDKEGLDEVVSSKDLPYYPDQFVSMYNEDQIGGLIRNLEFWVKDCFENLVIKK